MTTTHRITKNIPAYIFSAGSLDAVPDVVARQRQSGRPVVWLIDEFFKSPAQADVVKRLGASGDDIIRFVDVADEPKTRGIDQLVQDIRSTAQHPPCVVVGMGGGTTLDTAKAVSNLLGNPGPAAQYQGWDLLPNPGTFKIGIPTISGTGAESSRTCVMTNTETGLKLGMNSDYTLFDFLILDPALTATVDRNQYFYTGMDAYIHCIESLAGRHRHAVADAYSAQVVSLCRDVFLNDDMQASESREKMMTASFLGGCALASSFVGLVHPLSAGLSVVLGWHHCVANCITMLALDEFYPAECREFRAMVASQGVTIPSGIGAAASETEIRDMCAAASLHERPLANGLGPDYRTVLTPERMEALYRRM